MAEHSDRDTDPAEVSLRRRALQHPGYLAWVAEVARTLANPENPRLDREDALRMFVEANEGLVSLPEGGAVELELDEIPEVWSNEAVESLLHGIASNGSEPPPLQDEAAHALTFIWLNRDSFSLDKARDLTPISRSIVTSLFETEHPD